MDESTRRRELGEKIEFRLYDIKEWCYDAQREDWEKKSGNKGFFYQASSVHGSCHRGLRNAVIRLLRKLRNSLLIVNRIEMNWQTSILR